MNGFRCSRCDALHEGPPLSYGAAAPALDVPEADWASRVQLGEEQCVLDDDGFFIKGNIEIPILGNPADIFVWTVWVSLSRENFERASMMWHDPRRVEEPPYFGWLSTALPCYPPTVLLKAHVHSREPGTRPLVELEPTDHPLAVEQRNGITPERIRLIAEAVLHPQR